MKRLLLALSLAVPVLAPAAALAQAQADGAPLTESPNAPKQQEEYRRPSGFWGSTRPAEHGAYRWRLLALGVVIATGTGFAMVRMIRRAAADRAADASPPPATAREARRPGTAPPPRPL